MNFLIKLGDLLRDAPRNIYLVPGTPILYIPDLEAIVLSDLHLGYEEALARGYMYTSGKRSNYVRYVGSIIVPRRQFKRIIEYLDKAYSLLDGEIRRVIIDGDLKHAFDRLLRQEKREVGKLLDYLREKDVEEIILIRGNHDNYLPLILKKYGLELVKYYETHVRGIGNVLFTHGHIDLDINGYDLVVIGHEHPAIRCLSSSKTPALIIMNTDKNSKILILPASGPYQAGTNISSNRNEYLSPIIRKHGSTDSLGVITWVPMESGEELPYSSYMEDISGIVSFKLVALDRKAYLYMGFNSLDDAMLICRL